MPTNIIQQEDPAGQSGEALLDRSSTITSQVLDESLSIKGCGRDDFIAIYCGSCGSKIKVPVGCRRRSCPDCRGEHFERLRKGYARTIRDLGLSPEQLGLITLTRRVKSGRGLKELQAETREALSRLRRRREWLSVVDGGIYALEVKEAEAGWNLHIHMLVSCGEVKKYPLEKGGEMVVRGNLTNGGDVLTGKRLGELWQEITGDSFVVDIMPVMVSRGGVQGALSYLLKYFRKAPVLLTQRGRKEYDLAFKGRRLIQAFGSWIGTVSLPERGPFPCDACGKVNWISEFQLSDYRWSSVPVSCDPDEGGVSAGGGGGQLVISF